MATDDFDADSMRMPHESNEEWYLRRKFLLTHFDKFSLERLKCLASCFINVTMMGCSYPPPLMEQVNLLSEDLRDDIKRIKDTKSKHTAVKFVKAQDDVKRKETSNEAKPSPAFAPPQNKPKPMLFVKSGDDFQSTDLKTQKPLTFNPQMNQFLALKRRVLEYKDSHLNAMEMIQICADKAHLTVSHNSKNGTAGFDWEVFINSVKVGSASGATKKTAKTNACEDAIKRLSCSRIDIANPGTNAELIGTNTTTGMGAGSGPAKTAIKRPAQSLDSLDKFLIIESLHQVAQENMAILKQSADFNRTMLDYEFADGASSIRCTVKINTEPIVDCLGETKAAAKSNAAAKAVKELRKKCWTVKVKQLADSDESSVTKDELGVGSGDDSSAASLTQAIPESNIGSKLLKMMGWAGGGVGKAGQGIAEPVSVESVVNREGLGLQADKGIAKNFQSTIRDTINNYVKSDKQTDLVFSANFTKKKKVPTATLR